jgi:hypothetical protein
MKLFIMQFSLFANYFPLLGPNILLGTFSHTFPILKVNHLVGCDVDVLPPSSGPKSNSSKQQARSNQSHLDFKSYKFTGTVIVILFYFC